VFAGIFGFV